MNHDELYEKCPKCNSADIVRESQSEYTGEGYRHIWDEYECKACGNIWRGEEGTDYI